MLVDIRRKGELTRSHGGNANIVELKFVFGDRASSDRIGHE